MSQVLLTVVLVVGTAILVDYVTIKLGVKIEGSSFAKVIYKAVYMLYGAIIVFTFMHLLGGL